VNETISVECPLYCEHCQGQVVPEGTAHQYQVDLPEIKPWVTEFVVHYGKCSQCGREVMGRRVRPRRPSGLAASSSVLECWDLPLGSTRSAG
jgi:hypothetical protein